MHKQGLLTTFVALLFAMTPALADHHKDMEMSADHEKHSTTNGAEHSTNGDSHKGTEHPAHEMGDEVKSKDYKNESDMSKDYKHNKQEADDAENAPHPAHKMGEGEEALDERGQE